MVISTSGECQRTAGRFRRLWSLAEIMDYFPAALFMQWSGIAGHYYKLFAETTIDGAWSGSNVITQADRSTFDAVMNDVEGYCTRLELVASVATIKKMRRCLADAKSKYREYFALGPELNGRMRDEIDNRWFISLTLKEEGYYKKPTTGWNDIIERYPDTVRDIEEASLCFALGRYAAAVFHSLQILELGVIDLGKIIGVTDSQLGWGATINALRNILKTKYQDRSQFQKDNSAFFEQINGTIEVVNSAWRNKVSHAQNKLILLTSDFTPDVAEEILIASRSFMRRLATDAPLPSAPLPG
jgi:hypothetical protein